MSYLRLFTLSLGNGKLLKRSDFDLDAKDLEDPDTDQVDNPSPRPGTPKQWHVGMVNSPSYVGVTFNDTKRGDWQFKSSAVIGMFANHRLLLPHIWIKLVDEDLGLTIQVGCIYTPTVNVTPPGALAATYDRYGAFLYSWDGAKLSKSFGHVIVDVGLGRPSSSASRACRPAHSASRRTMPKAASRTSIRTSRVGCTARARR